MNLATKLIFVGADKGGVGKTTVARVLHDYYREKGRPVFVFDTEFPYGNISRSIKRSKIINLESSSDQVLLFDSVIGTKNGVVIVDFRAGLITKLLQLLENIGFLAEAKKGTVDLVLMHVVGASMASIREQPLLANYAEYTKYVTVFNNINDAHFLSFGGDRDKGITIKKLDELVYEEIDRIGIGFIDFINASGDQKNSFILKGYARAWFGDIKKQLDANPVFR